MISKHLNRGVSAILVLSMLTTALTGCQQRIGATTPAETESEIVVTTAPETGGVVDGVAALGIDSNVLPSIDGVTIDGSAEALAPVNLTVGVINSVVNELQQRLMELGYMDDDEPTSFYGDATSKSVQYFQRQSGMPEDGICGVGTWDALMSDSAPAYSAKVGFKGQDITNIQYRLYNLGYLSNPDDVTGTYDTKTEEAVKKFQQVNDITVDGAVGRESDALLYSDEVKANIIALGEQSDLVKKFQTRLIELGYMTGDADGNFGQGTQEAIKSFQSRNDQIVDGYLGADTRAAIESDSAKPYAMRLGEQSASVKTLQDYLVKYGYLASDKASGYFGELTKSAVALFQQVNGLTADGTAGALTMNKLTSGSAKSKPKETAKKTTTTTKTNSSSSSGSSSSSSSGSSSSGSSSSSSSSSSGGGGATVSGSAGNLISIASSKIGCPYVWGAKGPNSFDCSGFVYWCLNQAGVGISYMTSSGWRNPGRFKRVSYNELQAGDIIVVSGHVGICAGGGTVIDASSSNGRVIHRSLSSWWANNFKAGWRIFS